MAYLIIHDQSGKERRRDLVEKHIQTGRTPDNDLMIFDGKVSRKHCAFEKIQEGAYKVIDLGSRNGIKVNGEKMPERILEPGDEIRIGTSKMIYYTNEQPAPKKEIKAQSQEAENFESALSASGIIEEVDDYEVAESGFYIFILNGPQEGKKYQLSREAMTIGRHKTNTLMLEDDNASSFHLEISQDKDSFVLKDLGSTNGTFVNNERENACVLQNGNIITIGKTMLFFGTIEVHQQFTKEEGSLEEKLENQESKAFDVNISDEELNEIEASLDEETAGTSKKTFLTHRKIIIALLVLFIGICYYINMLLQSVGPKEDLSNILKANPSFELTDSTYTKPEKWKIISTKDVGTLVVNNAAPNGGNSAIQISDNSNNEFGEIELVYDAPINFLKATTYELSGWIKTNKLDGFAAIKIQWTSSKEKFIETSRYSPFVRETQDWQLVAMKFEAPEWAENLRVSCAIIGSEGTALFDNVQLVKVKTENKQGHSTSNLGKFSLATNDSEIIFERNGVFTVKKNDQIVIWRGEFVLANKDLGLIPRQEMMVISKEPEVSDTKVKFKGVIPYFNMETNKTKLLNFEQTVSIETKKSDNANNTEQFFKFDYRIDTKKGELNNVDLGISCQTYPVCFGDEVVMTSEEVKAVEDANTDNKTNIVNERVTNILDTFEKENIAEVFLYPQNQQMVMYFEKPSTTILKKWPYVLTLKQILKNSTIKKSQLYFSFDIRNTSYSAQTKIKNYIDNAIKAIEDNKNSVALKILSDFINDFPEHNKTVWAKEEKNKILEKAKVLRMEAERFAMFIDQKLDNPKLIQDAVTKATELKNYLPNSDHSKFAEELIEKCNKLVENLDNIKQNKEIIDLLTWSQKALKHKSYIIARIFAENVIEKAPDTEYADKAKEVLEDIKKAEKGN